MLIAPGEGFLDAMPGAASPGFRAAFPVAGVFCLIPARADDCSVPPLLSGLPGERTLQKPAAALRSPVSIRSGASAHGGQCNRSLYSP